MELREPEARKAVVRAFLEGIRIDKAQRRAMLYWYQLPVAAGCEYPLSAIPLSSTILNGSQGQAVPAEDRLPFPASPAQPPVVVHSG